jgi:hypothetical protein
MCQLVQEFVLEKLTVNIYPEIEIRLSVLDLHGPILKSVRTFVYDMLEDVRKRVVTNVFSTRWYTVFTVHCLRTQITRSTIYDQIATAYGKLQVTLKVPGCEVLVEKISKRASAEDEL